MAKFNETIKATKSGRISYDIICDHWGGVRGDRVCNRHIRNDHRDAHRVLGDLHCLHWWVLQFIDMI